MNDLKTREKEAQMFWVNPIFLAKNTNRIECLPKLTIPCRLTLSLEELKSIKETRVEITFDD